MNNSMPPEFWFKLMSLILFDLLFALAFFVLMVPLSVVKKASYAVLKRNFKSYFSNPTGYVFLAIFVLLTSMAAFWPHEFFNANLANLNQLNGQITLIMLVFIPTITMGLWADEKRLGTDELLLTLPATDFDIVMGKYLAAVSVFSVSMMFSQICNFLVLNSLSLGSLDVGLFLTTYVGYWFIGLAMIALGMVASFMTHNLTLGFVLGIMVNAPFVVLEYSDAFVTQNDWVRFLSEASIGKQFADFGRGVVSLSSLAYFIMLAVVGIYLAMVLIGRRHWLGGKDGESLLWHYLLRSICLLVIAFAGTLAFVMHDIRWDYTENQTSSLMSETKELVRNISTDEPIRIEAFVSESVPKIHAQTKFDLINYLNEFRALNASKIDVVIHDGLEPFSEQADIAREAYGITPITEYSMERGALSADEIIMGAVVQSGLEKVVIPFFQNGVPVEYELIRSIGTVAEKKRKRLGILNADAQLFGGVQQGPLGGFEEVPQQLIIPELEKHFEVIEMNPKSPIDPSQYDLILAVQPSSLPPQGLASLIETIKAGVPTAIFDDPLPFYLQGATPIGLPRSSPFPERIPPEPKGDIRQLWDLLQIQMPGKRVPGYPFYYPDIVWQPYNPEVRFSRLGIITHEHVFVDRFVQGAPPTSALNNTVDVTADLRAMLLPFPGAIVKQPGFPKSLTFTPLVSTGAVVGTVNSDDVIKTLRGGGRYDAKRVQALGPAGGPPDPFVLAAWIEGNLGSPAQNAAAAIEDPAEVDKESGNRDGNIHVAVVADVDVLETRFVRIRALSGDPQEIQVDNITFALNLLDKLAGDDDYIAIRSRNPPIARLGLMESLTSKAQEESDEAVRGASQDADLRREELRNELQKPINDIERKIKQLELLAQRGDISGQQYQEEMTNFQLEVQQRQLDIAKKEQAAIAKIEANLKRKKDLIERDLSRDVLAQQNHVKTLAVALPPIPPIVIGIIVFVVRRLKEREGLSKDRIVK